MSRAFTPKIVTANALLDGDVVYLAPDHRWARHLDAAAVFTSESEANAALAAAQTRIAEVVGAYLADVKPDAGGPQPTHFREAFRRKGPSNYPHGKQAEAR